MRPSLGETFYNSPDNLQELLSEDCGNLALRQPPNRANQRNVSEMSRLFDAPAEVVPASQIGPWLDTPNPAFEGSTPLQVIERNKSDRLWRMIWELRMGNSGD
jgi:hypothetical protein